MPIIPGIEEGGLAVRLNALVRRRGVRQSGRGGGAVGASHHGGIGIGQRRPAESAILAGACEAVIAALYLDGGMEAAKRFMLRYWEEPLARSKPELRDAKTALAGMGAIGRAAKKVQPDYAVTAAHRTRSRAQLHGRSAHLRARAAAGEGPPSATPNRTRPAGCCCSLGVWKE